MFHLARCMFFIVWTIMLYCCPHVLEQPILFHQDVGLPPESGRPHCRGSAAERRDIHQARPRSVFLQPPTAPRVHPHPPNIGRQGLEQEVQRGETSDTNKTLASEKEDCLKFLRTVWTFDRWMRSSKKISTKPRRSFLKHSTTSPSLLLVWLRFIKQNCMMGPLSP